MRQVLFLLALVFCVQANAQWTVFYHDSDKTYTDAAFPTANDIYIIGSKNSGGSYVLRSTDAGMTWTTRNLPFSYVSRISMLNATEGYLVRSGSPSILVYTTDGFSTFVTHNLDSAYAVVDLYPTSSSTGFFLNNAGRFRSFTQFGAQYQYLNNPIFNPMAMSFANAQIGYLSNGNELLKTTDSGLTWSVANANTPFMSELLFTSSDTGYATDYGTGIFQTTNGGLQFQTIYTFIPSFLAAQTHWVAASDQFDHVHWSSDYGQTWANETTGTLTIDGIFINPAGECFLFDNTNNNIVKRQVFLNTAESSNTFAYQLYPNPATSQLVVFQQGPMNTTGLDLRIVDARGALVYSGAYQSGNPIAIEHLAPGMYALLLTSKNELIYQQRFIKQQ